jgi:hypothetical protein
MDVDINCSLCVVSLFHVTEQEEEQKERGRRKLIL